MVVGGVREVIVIVVGARVVFEVVVGVFSSCIGCGGWGVAALVVGHELLFLILVLGG